MATTTMRFVKTPTSSLSGNPTSHLSSSHLLTFSATATELLGHQIWYRSKAIFNKLRRRGASKISAPRSSPIARLPQELVEIIISYFIHDTKTLLACSTTCYAWYIAVVPHLHYNLTTDNWLLLAREERYRWPTPLQRSYKLGLLPLVKRFRIRLNYSPFSKFSPDWLNKRNLRYFTALTNLQELGIDDLQLSDFMPNIQHIFGHFAPTLRFLALRQPEGTCREILYFIGLFPNLQDLKLCYSLPLKEEDGEDNPALVPLSTPPLRGRLTLTCFTRDSLVKGMITSFGGLRFRSMDLFRVTCAQLLLDSCAETLETIRLYPTDPCGEFFERKSGEKELNSWIDRSEYRGCTPEFQPLAEHVASNARNHRCIHQRGWHRCRQLFPDRALHHYVPRAPRCRYYLQGV